MIWITGVCIENFQSHEYTELDFEKGLNVITGPSDQGKSSILRAIKWVLYNEPRGLEFIRQGTSTAIVTLKLSNGNKIKREKSKSKNRYTIISEDGEQTVFEGFGNDVPEEVVKAHGIPKIVIDNDISSGLNMGEQLEAPFLVAESASVRAKAIGRLIGLHIIDRAIRDSLVDLRRENQTAERLKNELDDIGLRFEKYKNLKDLEKRLSEADVVIKRLEDSANKKNKLETIKISLVELDIEIKEHSEVLKRLSSLYVLEGILKDSLLSLEKFKKVQRLNLALKEVDSGIDECSGVLKETSDIDGLNLILEKAVNYGSSFRRLHELHKELMKTETEINTALKVLSITEGIVAARKMTDDITEKSAKLKKLLDVQRRLLSGNKDILGAETCLRHCPDIKKQQDTIDSLKNNNEKLQKLEAIKERFTAINLNLTEGSKYLNQNNIELQKLLSSYREKLQKAGKCPLCSSDIDSFKLIGILKHYEEGH